MSKKIAYIVGDLHYANGMSRVLSQKINWLARNTDYQIYMVLTEKADKPFWFPIEPNVKYVNFDINFEEIHSLPIHKKVMQYLKKQRQYKRELAKYLTEIKPDITITTLRRDINFICDINDGSIKIGEIHFSKKNYREFKKNFLPECVNKSITNLWRRQLYKQIKRLKQFVVLTNEDAKEWRKEFSNITVINNPINKYPSQTSPCDSKKVIAVGRYTWQKGFDMLIEAWKQVDERHPDWELHIYGPGDSGSYQKLAGHGVFCHTVVNDIYPKYLESSIYAFPSRYEGFGLVLAEAMSCGLPAVSFSCPCGPKDIITNDGILIAPNAIDNFADGLCQLIKDEKMRKEMGENAHENMKRYSEEVIMQKWVALFKQVLDN